MSDTPAPLKCYRCDREYFQVIAGLGAYFCRPCEHAVAVFCGYISACGPRRLPAPPPGSPLDAETAERLRLAEICIDEVEQAANGEDPSDIILGIQGCVGRYRARTP